VPRSSSAGNRPVTPIPVQFTNHHQQLTNNNRSNSFNNKIPLGPPTQPVSSSLLAHPTALMPNKSIPSLMSFNNHNSFSSSMSKDNLMTPTSPVNDINCSIITNGIGSETKIIKETAQSPPPPTGLNSIPQPPDSPVCETASIVVPKLIPLERNLTIPLSTTTATSSSNNNNKNQAIRTSSNFSSNYQKLKSVDIASPDAITNSEEDDDNLVIDLIPTSNSFATARHLMSSNSSSSSSNRIIKSPCILEEDLVNNEKTSLIS